jgi:hypothetical protein
LGQKPYPQSLAPLRALRIKGGSPRRRPNPLFLSPAHRLRSAAESETSISDSSLRNPGDPLQQLLRRFRFSPPSLVCPLSFSVGCRVSLLFVAGPPDRSVSAGVLAGFGGSGPLDGWICAGSLEWVRSPAVVLGLRRPVTLVGFVCGRRIRCSACLGLANMDFVSFGARRA